MESIPATNEAAKAKHLGAALWTLTAVILLCSVQHVFWLSEPRDRLVSRTIFDDAFYYFQTSRSVAEGLGSVSSGGIPHNGYHPLWMLVCAGFFKVFSDPMTAIRAILVLGVALSIAASFAVWSALLRLGCGAWTACLGAAVFHCNPYMVALSTGGLEAPLNALLLALLLNWSIEAERDRLSWRGWAGLGLTAGLVYLVRTDNAFFLAAVWLWLGARGGRRGLSGLLVASGCALVLVLPWHVWNWMRFGDFMQGSASALPYVREVAFFDANPDAGPGALLRRRAWNFLLWFRDVLYFSGLGSFWFLLFAGVGAVLLGKRGREGAGELGRGLLRLLPLAVAVVCLGLAHKFFRLNARSWYFVAPDLLMAVLLGLCMEYLTRVAPRPARSAVWLVAMVLIVAFLAKKSHHVYDNRLNLKRIFAIELLDRFEKLAADSPDEVFGATDSGLIGFFCSRPVVNLDGVVNPDAARAAREGRLLEYAQSRGIRRLTITPRMQSARILGPDWQEKVRPHPELSREGFEIRGGVE